MGPGLLGAPMVRSSRGLGASSTRTSACPGHRCARARAPRPHAVAWYRSTEALASIAVARCTDWAGVPPALCRPRHQRVPWISPVRGLASSYQKSPSGAETIERMSAHLNDAPAMARVLHATRVARTIILAGEAGTGKITVAGALATRGARRTATPSCESGFGGDEGRIHHASCDSHDAFAGQTSPNVYRRMSMPRASTPL